MKLLITEEFFGPLWPYIIDDNVTDIKWNGTTLWIDDLTKGRYMARSYQEGFDDKGNIIKRESPIKLDKEWVEIFTQSVANSVNENFNTTEPSLKAETDELRIQAEHFSVSGNGTTCFAIRKTPAVSRLAKQNLTENGYVTPLIDKLLPCLMRARCSGIITGDVGSGKTELEKYMAGFIPETDGIFTIEDTLEMKLDVLYPNKDVFPVKISDIYPAETAISDALRLMNKWIIIAESRGRDIKRVIEGASTGCTALTTIHAENAWQIPDRIMSMVGDNANEGFENMVYDFFKFAIKIKVDKTEGHITRNIDQLCFFERNNKQNNIVRFVVDGKWTGEQIPDSIYQKFVNNKETEFLQEFQKSQTELNKLTAKETLQL